MSRTGEQSTNPRAVIHKRILDAAESDPSASMAELADGIGGASTDLVERVLERYGDPGGAESDPDEDTRTMENGRSDEGHPDLTDGQLRALRLIERNPDATQGDIAAEFDVTRATISRWLNDVPGFEWPRRGELATRILNGDVDEEASDPAVPGEAEGDEGDESVGDEADRQAFEELDSRIERIERRLERLEATGTEPSAGTEPRPAGVAPELAHRVVHACLQSDRISEEEELMG